MPAKIDAYSRSKKQKDCATAANMQMQEDAVPTSLVMATISFLLCRIKTWKTSGLAIKLLRNVVMACCSNNPAFTVTVQRLGDNIINTAVSVESNGTVPDNTFWTNYFFDFNLGKLWEDQKKRAKPWFENANQNDLVTYIVFCADPHVHKERPELRDKSRYLIAQLANYFDNNIIALTSSMSDRGKMNRAKASNLIRLGTMWQIQNQVRQGKVRCYKQLFLTCQNLRETHFVTQHSLVDVYML